MKIAIIGAGLAGLSVARYLQNHAVHLFHDHQPASAASTGLLHPFPGKSATRSWRAEEGMRASHDLIAEIEQFWGNPVADRRGIFRFVNEAQKKAMQNDPDALEQNGGFYISNALAVYSQSYLKAFRTFLAHKGVIFLTQTIEHLDDLKDFDRIVLATGSHSLKFGSWPLKKTKGQALICRVKERPPMALLGDGHITPTEDPEIWQVGSTYERNFQTEGPDLDTARPLLEKVASFFPAAKDFQILDVLAGVRMSPLNGYKPLCEQIDSKTWLFTGLGSRGLLYHALLGKELANAIEGKK